MYACTYTHVQAITCFSFEAATTCVCAHAGTCIFAYACMCMCMYTDEARKRAGGNVVVSAWSLDNVFIRMMAVADVWV